MLMQPLGKSIRASYQKGVSARKAAEAERTAAEAAREIEFFRQQSFIVLRASAVISALPDIFEQAGINDVKSVQVCSTNYRNNGFYVPGIIAQGANGMGNTFEALDVPDVMFDAARVRTVHLSKHGIEIWDQLLAAGLQPYIKFNHDGCGTNDWYEIWVDIPNDEADKQADQEDLRRHDALGLNDD